MKTYIITEQDIETLRELFCVSKLQSEELDEWVETLNGLSISKKLNIAYENKTEFLKFIEENNFTKPEQPYYVKDGKIFDYGALRILFLESKNC